METLCSTGKPEVAKVLLMADKPSQDTEGPPGPHTNVTRLSGLIHFYQYVTF